MKTQLLADISSLVFIYVSCHNYVAADVIEMDDILSDTISSTGTTTTAIRNATGINGTDNYCAHFFSKESGENITWPESQVGSTVRMAHEMSICGAEAVRVCEDGGEWGDFTMEPELCTSDVVKHVLVYIGYSMSLVACLIAFLVFLLTRSSLKSLSHYQYHIHWNLITSFILYHVIFLIAFIVVPSGLLTNVRLINLLNVLLAYVVLANFFWMLVEGLVLFVLVATAFPGEQRGRAFVKWIMLGWGIPAFLVITWAIIVKVLTPADSPFILRVNNDVIENYICLVAPVFVALLINCIVVAVVMRILWLKLQADARTGVSESEEKTWRTAKSTFVLLILLGVYYTLPMIIFVFNPPYIMMYVVSYISSLVSSVQGLAVSTFYVFCNAEVRDQVQRALRNYNRQWRYNYSPKYSIRLSSRSSSGTPKHSKSHSSSDGCGKLPVREGEGIEMTSSADVNWNIKDDEHKREMCVIMEHAPLAAGESYGSIRGYVRLSTNEPEDV